MQKSPVSAMFFSLPQATPQIFLADFIKYSYNKLQACKTTFFDRLECNLM
jgi:hypothetical protein